ncbi:MAG: transposase, partial [Bryobacteraceae bacterium]
QQFIRDQKGRLVIEYLPPYAPELNPVEYIWAHCKHHELPNVCAKNLWDLSEAARRSLKRMRRRPRLITAFWKQASLFDRFRYIMRNSVVFPDLQCFSSDGMPKSMPCYRIATFLHSSSRFSESVLCVRSRQVYVSHRSREALVASQIH